MIASAPKAVASISAIDFRGRGVKCLSNKEAREALVHQNFTIPLFQCRAIRPDSGPVSALAVRESSSGDSDLSSPRLDGADEPLENVADGGLARFRPEKAWQDAAVDDTAQSGNVRRALRYSPFAVMSQVLVPMILTSVPAMTPAPIAPR